MTQNSVETLVVGGGDLKIVCTAFAYISPRGLLKETALFGRENAFVLWLQEVVPTFLRARSSKTTEEKEAAKHENFNKSTCAKGG